MKIDKSFIRDLNDIQDVAITRMIISLANSLRLEVIGEGVEMEDQHALKQLPVRPRIFLQQAFIGS